MDSVQVFDGTDWIPDEIKEMLRLKDLEIFELKATIKKYEETNNKLLSRNKELSTKLERLENFIGECLPENNDPYFL
jgi:thiamine kinase-like enzyme